MKRFTRNRLRLLSVQMLRCADLLIRERNKNASKHSLELRGAAMIVKGWTVQAP